MFTYFVELVPESFNTITGVCNFKKYIPGDEGGGEEIKIYYKECFSSSVETISAEKLNFPRRRVISFKAIIHPGTIMQHTNTVSWIKYLNYVKQNYLTFEQNISTSLQLQ